MENPLIALSAQLTAAVARAAESVVTVHARPRITSSGVVWAKGLIVTADHTIAREEEIHLTLPDNFLVEAKLKARDSATGIALLEYAGSNHPAINASSQADPKPGAVLLAVGRNADTGPTASMGILSAAGGPWRTWRGGHLDRFLRLDMNLFPGSAGGIVVDAEGRFIGVASDGLSRLSPLAIPASTLSRVVKELIEKGRVARGYLGVGLQPVRLPTGPGVILLSVERDTAAERAGLLVGDVLTALDAHKVAAAEDVQEFLSTRSPGTKVTARIVRGGQVIEQTVELGDRVKSGDQRERINNMTITGFGEVGEHLRRSTVHIGLGREGQGSGVIWDPTGLIITNAHVARDDRSEITLWDGRRYPAMTAFRDDSRDLAALRIQAPDLTAASVGDSSKLSPGEVVIAVGNPLGFIGALTTGVVHAVGPLAGLSRRDYVQASVRLAPGNSGGPLADAQGRVVGINSMVIAGGLGLAVPSNAVRDFLARRGARVTLGISVRPVTVRFRSREAPGILILEVAPNSPADRASLMVGDILVAAGDRSFETFDDLSWSIENANGSLPLKFLRGDRRTVRETTVLLAQPEARAA